MRQRNGRRGLLRKLRSPLRRSIVAAGVAMIVIPEPVTTAIGAAMVSACLGLPERQNAVKLAYCGASVRRGSLKSQRHS